MKPSPFNHKFVIVYIFLTPKTATPLLVGVAIGGCGSCVFVPHLPISAIYLPIWTKFNHKFFIDYIFEYDKIGPGR